MVDPSLQWVTKVKVGSSAEAEPDSNTKKTDNDLDESEYEDSGKHLATRAIVVDLSELTVCNWKKRLTIARNTWNTWEGAPSMPQC